MIARVRNSHVTVYDNSLLADGVTATPAVCACAVNECTCVLCVCLGAGACVCVCGDVTRAGGGGLTTRPGLDWAAWQ